MKWTAKPAKQKALLSAEAQKAVANLPHIFLAPANKIEKKIYGVIKDDGSASQTVEITANGHVEVKTPGGSVHMMAGETLTIEDDHATDAITYGLAMLMKSPKPKKKKPKIKHKKFPEDFTMTDQFDLQRRVALRCQQCNRIVTNVIWYGMTQGQISLRALCHNSHQIVSIPIHNLDGRTFEKPFLMDIFGDPTSKKAKESLPNIRFYCRVCDALTGNFTYQYHSNEDKHYFEATCDGHVCGGRRHHVIFAGQSLKQYRIGDHKCPPTILPLQVVDFSTMVMAGHKQGALKTPVIEAPKKLRKLRFD